jgi:hypothetical protein
MNTAMKVNTLSSGPTLNRNGADLLYVTEVFRASDADCIGKMMAVAILFQAAEDLKKFRHELRPAGKMLYGEVRDWVTSNNDAEPGSFINVCRALELTANGVRADLLADEPLPHMEGT